MLFDSGNGILIIEGKSYIEDALYFYKPLIDKIKDYVNQP